MAGYYFVGLTLYMSLCLSVTVSAVESEEEYKINETVYIGNGAALAELPCSKVPQAAVGIEWFIYTSTEWKKLLKFYHTNPVNSGNPKYCNDSTKYDISQSVSTSLVVKNIKLSDSGLFMCGFVGGSNHTYTIMLKVVGKSLLTHLFTLFSLPILKCVICLKAKIIVCILNVICNTPILGNN